jgi:hypothetical protein
MSEDTIEEFFKTFSLYRKFHGKWNKFPPSLSLYCNHAECKKETTWVQSARFHSEYSTFWTFIYSCANCKENRITYWVDKDKDKSLTKVGQFPPQSADIPINIRKHLNETDLDLYEKGLICKNLSYGMGALVYMRRIIENKINSMIDVVAGLHKQHKLFENDMKNIKTIKSSKKFEDKIKFASKLLPPNLLLEGENPFKLLYSLLNTGIHTKSDDECLEIAEKISTAFEYIFEQLHIHTSENKKFIESIKELERKKTKKSKSPDEEKRELAR